jgi:hypothetical protein
MVSNKTLALIIVATMIVSLGGTLLNLDKLQEIERAKGKQSTYPTGFATSSGNVSLVLGDLTQCTVNSNVSFGTITNVIGTVILNTDRDNAAAGATGANDCSSDSACQGMEINNTGNTNLIVNLTSNINGTTLLGGVGASNDDFQFITYNGTNSGTEYGCMNGLNNTWRYVNESNPPICLNLSYIDTQDMIHVEYNVTIDGNTPPGTKSAIITITCEQV